jgi:WYL domain-containing protein
MSQATLCAAIASRKLVRFYYAGDKKPGYRTVEPHMVAYNNADHLALHAWFLGGASKSQEGHWWREYLLSSIYDINVLPDKFPGPRDGYKPDGGEIFHNIQCAL